MNGPQQSGYINNDGWSAPWKPGDAIQPEERTYSTFVHLSAYSAFLIPFGNILGPLVLWLARKDQSEFLDDHGREAINFQISMLLFTIASGVLVLCGIGIILLPVFIILGLVMPIVMAVKSNRGEYVRYPMTIRFLVPKSGV
jgi:uncharacterized Tic20 family protein